MHIGFDAKRCFQNTTGLGNYARSVLAGLSRYFPEHRYTLYTPRSAAPFATLAKEQGLAIREPSPPLRPFPALWRSLAIPTQARKDQVDIYHGLSHELPLSSFGPRIRTLVTMHDLLFLTHPHLYPWLDRHIYTQKYRASCRKADLILAISQKTAQDVQELFAIPEERIRVAYQSCNESFRALATNEALTRVRTQYALPDRYILFVSSLAPRKGADVLLEALALVPKAQRPGVVLVGTGPLRHALQTRAQNLGLGKALFLGAVPAHDLPALYQQALIFAYPSKGEGFGIPILEAMSCRVPVITSTGSCFAEVGADAALYTTPGNAQELAEALGRVTENAGLRHTMIERGIQQAERFHPERTTGRLMDIYRELVPSCADQTCREK